MEERFNKAKPLLEKGLPPQTVAEMVRGPPAGCSTPYNSRLRRLFGKNPSC